jgi:transcription initiation factor TFIIIB Brf1 subunit/transcription initiation factor TFIIB
MFLLKPWKKIMCKRDIHVFDEVVSFGGGRRHELVCDACGLVVNIESIDDQYTTGK